jgi:predicted permease
LNHEARFVCLVYLACPTAVASFVMAQAMKGDAILAAGTVAVSTVYSCVALSVVLLLAGG